MNRFVAWTLAAGLACAFAGGTAVAAEPTPQALLTDAILCKKDPLAIVRKMAASGSSQFDRGFAARNPWRSAWTASRTSSVR